MAAETSFSKGTCQWIVLLRDEKGRGEETSGEGEGCFARYINLILWILDRWWKESTGRGGSGRVGRRRAFLLPPHSLNIHRKEGIEIGCNRI